MIFSSLSHNQLNPILGESPDSTIIRSVLQPGFYLSPEKDKIFFVFPRTEVNPFLRTSCQILLGNGTAGMNNFIYLFKIWNRKVFREKWKELGCWMCTWGLGKTLGFIVSDSVKIKCGGVIPFITDWEP